MDKIAHQSLCASFGSAAQSFGAAALARGLDEASASKLAAKVEALADRELKQVTERGDIPLACHAGCDACCHTMPTASAPEVARIMEAVQNWPEDARQLLVGRLSEYVTEAETQRSEGFLRFRKPCPFLADHLCSIYEVRPIFCRGLSSESASLCERFNEDPTAEEVFGPNGELGLAQAIIAGLSKGSAPAGSAARVEVPRAVFDALTQPGFLVTLLSNPAAHRRPMERPWRLAFPPSLPPFAEQPESLAFLEARRARPIEEVIHLVGKPTTANALARIFMPSALRSKEEMETAWLEFNRAIDVARECKDWNPVEAYHSLKDLRPIGAAYQPHDMKPAMAKIGKLLRERIAQPLAPDLLEPLGPRRPGRIRVAIAGDIADKSGANWALGWARGLDRSRFEVFVLKLGGAEDAVTYRFKDVADHYHWLQGDELSGARFVRSLDLDYLIYPDLGDDGSRYRYAIFRLARFQATAWGCPFTSGLETMDDYLSSDFMERAGAHEDYTENLVRLPHAGLTLEAPTWPTLESTRARFGLPDGFLASFPQYVIKWLPEHDRLLAEISQRLENPIVFFEQGIDYEIGTFKARMDKLGVRALWLPRTRNTATFRAIVRQFDVCLDAPGWSGGLTAMHCLSLGTPFVSLPGKYLRQRLALGFSRQASAEAWVAKDEADFVALATSRERLEATRQTVRSTLLFGDEDPLRALESHIEERLQRA